jgi:hypothetical protein
VSDILLLDIETLPGTAYVWSLWGENVPVQQLVTPSRVVCWSAKWLGKPEVLFGAEWKGGHNRMLRQIHRLLSRADAVITYNGDKFDLPKLHGEFLLAGLDMPGGGATSIDLYKTAKKLGYISNKLVFVAPLLSIGEKESTGGFDLWRKVDQGNKQAQKDMESYNKQDTVLLESLYYKLRPYIKNHPYLGDVDGRHCPACESPHIQKRGVRRTKGFIIERLHCQECGSWSDGTRRKAGK